MTATAILDQFYAPSVLTVCNEALAPTTTAPEVHHMGFSRTRRPFVRHSHIMAQGTIKRIPYVHRGWSKWGRNVGSIVQESKSKSRDFFLHCIPF